MKFLILVILAAMFLTSCSLLPAQYGALEEGAAQVTIQSSERAICRDIPIAAWIKFYGMSSSRLTGWQDICFNPVTTPLNDATVQAILKAYPSADVKPQTAPILPSSTIQTAPVTAPVAAPVSPVPIVSAPVVKKAAVKPVAPVQTPAPTAPVVAPAPTPAAPVPKTQPFGALPPPSTGFGAVGQ